MINETHDKDLTSWVPGAEGRGGDFPIQNLPFGAFVPKEGGGGVWVSRLVTMSSICALPQSRDSLEETPSRLPAPVGRRRSMP